MVKPEPSDAGVPGVDRSGALVPLARTSRMVFFAGLPATGKSVLVRRLARAAHRLGRRVHLLQWDVARPVFEACPAGRRYPMIGGVTRPTVRKAAGLWARDAVVRWHERHPDPACLLIGETPLVGHRFIELARPAADGAEALLAGAACRFLVAVPSVEVRRRLTAARRDQAARGPAGRAREDAMPPVLQALWLEVLRAAELLRLGPGPAAAGRGYDPAIYEAVYRRVLSARRAETLPLERWAAGGRASAYGSAVPTSDLVPAPDEADGVIRAVEERYPDERALEEEMARWYEPETSPR